MPNESEHIPDALPGLRVNSSREIVNQKIKKHEKNKLRQICQLFSSIDFFWKKECTGGTRLMRK